LAERSDPSRETQVAWRVRRYLVDSGYRVRSEIPFISKRIDLVGVMPLSGTVVAIEAKVSDWRRGLQQALPYRLCSHMTFLAISARYLHRVDRVMLGKFGVGLIAVDGSARIEMAARTSRMTYPKYVEAVRSQVMQGD